MGVGASARKTPHHRDAPFDRKHGDELGAGDLIAQEVEHLAACATAIRVPRSSADSLLSKLGCHVPDPTDCGQRPVELAPHHVTAASPSTHSSPSQRGPSAAGRYSARSQPALASSAAIAPRRSAALPRICQTSFDSSACSHPSALPPPTGTGGLVITVLVPARAASASKVRILGTHLFGPGGYLVATFDGAPSPTNCPSETECIATVPPPPPGTTSVTVRLETRTGMSNGLTFDYGRVAGVRPPRRNVQEGSVGHLLPKSSEATASHAATHIQNPRPCCLAINHPAA